MLQRARPASLSLLQHVKQVFAPTCQASFLLQRAKQVFAPARQASLLQHVKQQVLKSAEEALEVLTSAENARTWPACSTGAWARVTAAQAGLPFSPDKWSGGLHRRARPTWPGEIRLAAKAASGRLAGSVSGRLTGKAASGRSLKLRPRGLAAATDAPAQEAATLHSGTSSSKSLLQHVKQQVSSCAGRGFSCRAPPAPRTLHFASA